MRAYGCVCIRVDGLMGELWVGLRVIRAYGVIIGRLVYVISRYHILSVYILVK